MNDCDHPKCHEHFTIKIEELFGRIKMLCAKKVGWWSLASIVGCILVVVGIPLFIVAADVWSDQGNDVLRYATKDDLVECTSRIIAIETAQFHYLNAAKRTADAVEEIQKDLKGLLKSRRFEPNREN